MQFDDLSFPSEVVVADVVEAKVQAMNLGRSKIYNVRAEIAADGLKPQGTIFIGDMEAGTAANRYLSAHCPEASCMEIPKARSLIITRTKAARNIRKK